MRIHPEDAVPNLLLSACSHTLSSKALRYLEIVLVHLLSVKCFSVQLSNPTLVNNSSYSVPNLHLTRCLVIGIHGHLSSVSHGVAVYNRLG